MVSVALARLCMSVARARTREQSSTSARDNRHVTRSVPTLSPASDGVIYILPISGPFFPIQLLSLVELQTAANGTFPRMVLGSSGGAIVSLLGAAGHWNAAEIRRVASTFDSSKIFHRPSNFLPGIINWSMVGSLIMPAASAYDWVATHLDVDFEKLPEHIIGTYCIDTFSPALFSTRMQSSSYFSENEIEAYCGGDLKTLTRAAMASAAIPEILPPVKVLADSTRKYVDGGLFSPSPWSSVWSDVVRNTNQLKIIYFISTISVPNPLFGLVTPLLSLVDSMCIRESIDLLEQFRNKAGHALTRLEFSTVSEAYAVFKSKSQALMFIRPKTHEHVYSFDMTSFTGQQLTRVLDTKNFLTFEIWF